MDQICMYRKNDQHKRLGYKSSFLLILGILYINNSIMFKELYSATFRGIITMVLLAIILIANAIFMKGKLEIVCNYRMLIFYIIAIVCSILSMIVNGMNYEYDIYALFLLTIAFVISTVVSRKMFYRVYVDVMTIIALLGGLCFLLYAVAPSLFSIFPVYSWHSGILMKNCFICVVSISTQNYRNFGIFYEPGMFSVFLVFALFIELFMNKPDLKKVFILFVALLTTLSTNGYICAVLLLIAYFTTCGIQNNPYLKKHKRKIIYSLVALVMCGIIFLCVNVQARIYLLDKLNEITFGGSLDNTTTGSGYERYRSIVYAIEAFFSNPIFGIGYIGWLKKFDNIIATATPLNWFGLRGIVYGVMMNWFYFKNGFGIDKHVGGFITKVFLCVILLFNVISQNMSSDIIMYLLILYQCTDCKVSKNKNIRKGLYETN